MLSYPCRVLLVEDKSEDIQTVQTMLGDFKSAFFVRGFELTSAKTLTEAKRILSESDFDVVLLDLMLPDSRNMDSLKTLQAKSADVPIVVQTALEDEVVAVKALELGACGYLPKVASDRNLLLYAIRAAIERKRQLALIDPSQQQQELDVLDRLMNDGSDFHGDDSLKTRIPDIFTELQERYLEVLTSFVEQRIYKVESELSSRIKIFVEQLGYLQATPRDLIELHTTSLKQLSSKKSKAYLIEGRFLLLELIGRLAIYYRRYYVGLNKINLTNADSSAKLRCGGSPR